MPVARSEEKVMAKKRSGACVLKTHPNLAGCCCQCKLRLEDLESDNYICLAPMTMRERAALSGHSEHGMCELFTALPVLEKRGLEDIAPIFPPESILNQVVGLYYPFWAVPDADQTLIYEQCTCTSESTAGSQTCLIHGW